ncbi:MAG TPA: leucyl/phenylalanyl-tRNA--protein transferase [Dongiaceae bacterium]
MLLRAYALGIFPMAERRLDDEIYWVDPERRGVLPLEGFHLPRRLARTVRQARFEIRCDTSFDAVVDACAEPDFGRPETWINTPIQRLSAQLFALGYAHSVECWRGRELVGGLYGISLGGAFFGESMFSRERDASKVALVHLVLRLRLGGYRLLDTQFITSHLAQFGTLEITRADYRRRLADAIAIKAQFYGEVAPDALTGFLQSSTQRS